MATLPPGPSNLVGTFLRYLVRPHDAFAALARKYGDPFLLPIGSSGSVVTGDPEGIKAIMGSDPDTFEPFHTDASDRILGKHSLFFTSGPRHRAARRILGIPFHGARMHGWGRRIGGSTLARLRALRPGEPFSMQKVAQWIALDVIVPAVFGVTDPARVKEFHDIVFAGFDRVGPAVLHFRLLQHEFGGIGPWARVQRMVRELGRLTAQEITARRAQDFQDGDDVLGALLCGRYDDGCPLTDEDIGDKLYDMVIAGYETSAIALAWAVYEICRDQHVYQRIVAELATTGADPDFEALLRLPYLHDVIQETMRLHPVFALLTRRLKRPLQLKGYDLPSGIGVSAAIGSVHLREDVYADAHAFRPERFRGRTYSPFEYLPFGGGAQRCLGAAFAAYQTKIVLATIFRSHRLRLCEDRPIRPVARAATVAPASGVRVAIAARL